MQEKFAFELLYERICALLGEIPAVFNAFFALPILVQQFVLVILLLVGINIITAAVEGSMKLFKWWCRRH